MMQKKSLERLAQVQKIISRYDFALTVRQIFYQLVVEQIIPNQKNAYTAISYLCVRGRDEGILPEEGFADRLRVIDKPSSWLDLSDFMVSVKDSYRKDKWQDQDAYIEVWTEKDALRNVLDEITHPYNVSLMVGRGQVSRTAIYESYVRFKEKIDEEKECYLYYAGDLDPSGVAIYNSLVERLKKYGETGESINFERFALTPSQIDEYNLPVTRAKRKDPNYKKFVAEFGNDNTAELDSLPPDVLRNLVKGYIERHIDRDILAQSQETEIEERTRLQEIIDQVNHPSLKAVGLHRDEQSQLVD